jgi:hypothetical protein
MLERLNGAILIVLAALLGACNGHSGLVVGTPNAQAPTGAAGTGAGGHTADAGAGAGGGMAGAGGGAAGSGAAGSGPSLPDGGSAPDATPLPPPQSWTGYLENSAFPSGSDDIKLTFTIDSAGRVVGTVVFGQGTPPPPATDPNVGYPASFHPGSGSTFGGAVMFLAEGYTYAFSGTLASNRLRFNAPFSQLWKDWCALQTSYEPDGACLPSRMATVDETHKCLYGGPKAGQWVPVDCDKLAMCLSYTICPCDAKSCQASPEGGGASFDLLITNDTADGSTVGTVSGNVHFTKDP